MTAPHTHRLREVERLVARIDELLAADVALVAADGALDTRLGVVEGWNAGSRLTTLEAGPGWTSFTPTLTATTTNPTLGSSPVQAGRYRLSVDDLIVVEFFIKFGTGSSAGSGTYIVGGWPTLSDLAIDQGSVYSMNIGTCRMVDVSTPANNVNGFVLANGRLIIPSTNSAANASAPFAWADGDEIMGLITTRAA